MVSSSFPTNLQDWKGRFIYNLAEALARQPDLALRLWAPPGNLPAHINTAATSSELKWIHEMTENGGIAHLLRKHPIQGLWWATGLLWRLHQTFRREQQSDIIHVNWLQNALPLLGTKTPLVISVLGSDMTMLQLPGVKALLRRVFQQRKTIITPNADWMITPIKKMFGDLADIQFVSFGVDQIWFDIIRTPVQPSLWITVTRITQKKIGTLFEWGEGLFDDNRQLHLFGPMQETLPLPPWVIYHGPTHPLDLAQNWFPKATGLLTLSQHDEGCPQVMLEAMAAGLPIIASDLPAHRDLILHQQTGCLARTKDETAVALEWLEQSEPNQIVGATAKALIKKTVGTWDDCAARYHSLYRRILDQ